MTLEERLQKHGNIDQNQDGFVDADELSTASILDMELAEESEAHRRMAFARLPR